MQVGFGDVVKFVEIAAKIYKYGFSKAHRAPSLYNEFGEHIKYLATNLDDLYKIIGTISQSGAQAMDSDYVNALVDIIGDYGRTLQDVDRFLKDKVRFSWQGDFINNIIWNFAIASEVQGLKDRIAWLNIKLLTVLKTLDLRMAQQLHINIFRIHRDLAARIDGARDDIIQQIQALRADFMEFLTTGSQAVASSSTAPASLFDIPAPLQNIFEQHLQNSSYGAEAGQFPLIRGLDAVVYHINSANSIAADNKESKRERQWLAAAKAFWITTKVKAGDEYKAACSYRSSNSFEKQLYDMGITIASYVKGLEIELLEIVKDSDLNTFTPTTEAMIQTFRTNPEMWLEFKEDANPTPTWELEFSEKIMNASLRGPYRDFDQALHLFKLTEVDLKLVITDTPKNGTRAGERTNNIMNVDIRRSRFIPLYATSMTPDNSGLNITFQGDRLASGSSALVFNKRSELFKFQHAITGYQVVLESIGIEVVTYTSSRVFGGEKTEYAGRLQLWRAKRPQNTTTPAEGSSSQGSSASQTSTTTVIAPTSPSPTIGTSPSNLMSTSPSTTMSTSPPSRDSLFSRSSTSSSSDGTIGRNRRDSALTTATTLSIPVSNHTLNRRSSAISVASNATGVSSSLSLATTRLASSTTSYTTSIVDASGNIGLTLSAPVPSMLVLLLQQQNKKTGGLPTYSTLGIEIDQSTHIDSSACDCRKNPGTCLRVVVQNTGDLISYRLDAGADLDNWNLAGLGTAQRKHLTGGASKDGKGGKGSSGGKDKGKEDKLSWVAIDFARIEEKLNFVTMFGQVRTLYVKQRAAYHGDLRRLQG